MNIEGEDCQEEEQNMAKLIASIKEDLIAARDALVPLTADQVSKTKIWKLLGKCIDTTGRLDDKSRNLEGGKDHSDVNQITEKYNLHKTDVTHVQLYSPSATDMAMKMIRLVVRKSKCWWAEAGLDGEKSKNEIPPDAVDDVVDFVTKQVSTRINGEEDLSEFAEELKLKRWTELKDIRPAKLRRILRNAISNVRNECRKKQEGKVRVTMTREQLNQQESKRKRQISVTNAKPTSKRRKNCAGVKPKKDEDNEEGDEQEVLPKEVGRRLTRSRTATRSKETEIGQNNNKDLNTEDDFEEVPPPTDEEETTEPTALVNPESRMVPNVEFVTEGSDEEKARGHIPNEQKELGIDHSQLVVHIEPCLIEGQCFVIVDNLNPLLPNPSHDVILSNMIARLKDLGEFLPSNWDPQFTIVKEDTGFFARLCASKRLIHVIGFAAEANVVQMNHFSLGEEELVIRAHDESTVKSNWHKLVEWVKGNLRSQEEQKSSVGFTKVLGRTFQRRFPSK